MSWKDIIKMPVNPNISRDIPADEIEMPYDEVLQKVTAYEASKITPQIETLIRGLPKGHKIELPHRGKMVPYKEWTMEEGFDIVITEQDPEKFNLHPKFKKPQGIVNLSAMGIKPVANRETNLKNMENAAKALKEIYEKASGDYNVELFHATTGFPKGWVVYIKTRKDF